MPRNDASFAQLAENRLGDLASLSNNACVCLYIIMYCNLGMNRLVELNTQHLAACKPEP